MASSRASKQIGAWALQSKGSAEDAGHRGSIGSKLMRKGLQAMGKAMSQGSSPEVDGAAADAPAPLEPLPWE